MPHFAGYRLWHSETLPPSPKAFTKQKVDSDFDTATHTWRAYNSSQSKGNGTTVRSEIKTTGEGLTGRKLSNTAEGQENLSEWKTLHIPGDDPSKQECQPASNLIQVHKNKIPTVFF